MLNLIDISACIVAMGMEGPSYILILCGMGMLWTYLKDISQFPQLLHLKTVNQSRISDVLLTTNNSYCKKWYLAILHD
jgi:hypothetical protein